MEQEQLTLNLQIRPAPSLDNFAVGDNAELVSVLRTMAETGSGPQFLYLWGETGVGCTHSMPWILWPASSGFPLFPRAA